MSHFVVDGKALPCVIKLKRSHFPLPQINLNGYKMEMPRPIMVITLKLHQFHNSHLIILNVEENLPHHYFDFPTLLGPTL